MLISYFYSNKLYKQTFNTAQGKRIADVNC